MQPKCVNDYCNGDSFTYSVIVFPVSVQWIWIILTVQISSNWNYTIEFLQQNTLVYNVYLASCT